MADTHTHTAAWYRPTARKLDRTLIAFTSLAVIVLLAFGHPGAPVSAAIMATCVALLGLPHGAYDLESARQAFEPTLGRLWMPLFVGLYLLGALAALGFWIASPALGLGVLLLLGAAHWGQDDLRADVDSAVLRFALGTSRGALPVALPQLFHPEATARIFSTLLGGTSVDPTTVRTIGLLSIALALPGIFRGLIRSGTPSRTHDIAEVLTLTLWFAVASPILAFTCYFCFWHSLRHSLRSMSRRAEPTLKAVALSYSRCAAPATIASILIGIAAVVWFVQTGATSTDSIWQVVFVGLFSVTVPHVILEWIVSRIDRPSVSQTSACAGLADTPLETDSV